jgi:hypothetical protein
MNLPSIDTFLPIALANLIVTLLLLLWNRASADGRAKQNIDQIARDITAIGVRIDILSAKQERDCDMQAETAVTIRDDVMKLSGVLIGLDGQNGMRSDIRDSMTDRKELRMRLDAMERMQAVYGERIQVQSVGLQEVQRAQNRTADA